ncbi:YeeE/YedE thiosulfate transporter family protein [Pectinatus frisingensis]|uniref:YeeE/YedE thiosulfate transporter family protein n=1 Tax=Pectinatus frisingensis TaxID=865 RepID=UPI0018C4A623|nr:YeeE/YedE thiosulfate transporter family protein [Pectinatus frisingensis]
MNQSLSSLAAARRNHKTKHNQLPWGIVVLAAIIGIAFFLFANVPQAAIMWAFGIIIGFTLQRSRFCFTASMRDPVLTGSTSLTKAVLLAIGVASIGFAYIQHSAAVSGLPIPGNISPVGPNTAIGAAMFGIGMVIAGGCASGTLMRVGEGFLIQIITLIFFIIGSLWGAHDFGWWTANIIPKTKIFLPTLIGWIPALVIQFGFLIGLYVLANKYGKRSDKSHDLQ